MALMGHSRGTSYLQSNVKRQEERKERQDYCGYFNEHEILTGKEKKTKRQVVSRGMSDNLILSNSG